MSAARILIVTNGHLCRNPRPLKEAVTLGRAGYDVTVLTVRHHAPSEPADRALLSDAPFRREVVELLPGAGPASFRRRLVLRLARDAATRLGWKTIHALGPAAALLRRAQSLPADLTLVHNEVPHWVGTRLLPSGRRVAADIEDWHSEDLLPDARAGRPLALLRATERTLLHRAAYTSTTSQALAEALHTRYGGRRPLVLSNSFPLQPDPRTGPCGEPPVFFWFSQTLGPGRGLEAFLAAWHRTRRPSRVVFLGAPPSNYLTRLLQPLAPAHRSAISFLPLVAPDALPALIARHDIGLALEQADILSRDLTITNKILQYLNAGLAVVASPTAGQREVLARAPDAGLLLNFADSAVAASHLDALLADRGALARRQAAARRAAEECYSWEREAPVLLAAVAAALGAAPR